jgi:hypothetical protein
MQRRSSVLTIVLMHGEYDSEHAASALHFLISETSTKDFLLFDRYQTQQKYSRYQTKDFFLS